MPNVRRFLDLSIRHLSDDNETWLRDHSVPQTPGNPPPATKTASGWFLYALGPAEFPIYAVPEHIRTIMLHATRYHCDYILFDDDGPEDPDLSFFMSPEELFGDD